MKTSPKYGTLVFFSLLGLLLGCDSQPVEIHRKADKAAPVGGNNGLFEDRLAAIKALLSSKEVTNQIRGLISVGQLAAENKSRLQAEPEMIAQLESFCKSTSKDIASSALAALSKIEARRSLPVFNAALASSDKWQHLFGAIGILAIPSSGRETIEAAVGKLVAIIWDFREHEDEEEALAVIHTAIATLEEIDEKAQLGFPNFADSIPDEIKAQRISPKEWKSRPDLIAIRKQYLESVRKWWTEKRAEIISRILSANTDVKK